MNPPPEQRSAASGQLAPLGRWLAHGGTETLWELDTAGLPRALRAYRRRVRTWSHRHLTPLVAAADADPEGFDPAPLLDAAARDGYLSDVLPPPWGTLPWRLLRHGPLMPALIKVEEFCAICAGLGLVLGAHHLGLAPLYLSGSWSALRRWALPIVRANRQGTPTLCAFAITEPDAGSDVEDTRGAARARLGTRARREGDHWRLSGRKCFITAGDLARYVTVFAALEDEGIGSWTAFVVERGMDGFSVGRHERKMGQRAGHAVELVFDGARLPDTHRIGPLRSGWPLNRATLAASRGPVGAIALGIARGALETAIAFVRRRTLGGKPMIAFEDIQLTIAQMVIDVWAMRSMVWQSARYSRPRPALAAATKVFCADRGWQVCRQAMALLGDAGLEHASGAEKRLRDIRLNQIYEGTNQINRLAVIEAFWESEFHQPPWSA